MGIQSFKTNDQVAFQTCKYVCMYVVGLGSINNTFLRYMYLEDQYLGILCKSIILLHIHK